MSQWTSSDKSTQLIATAFYSEYLSGHSSAQAHQKAAVSVTQNKSSGVHQPFHWASSSFWLFLIVSDSSLQTPPIFLKDF
ncbi:MAG: CHAT domain-containing protein [Acidobacteria bacterium]|nr:CHAT domain-containing protein [Acidobacteriota bacterium]